MRSAAEALLEERDRPRLTTGCGDLDSLIDGIRQGQFYLFYGNDQEVLDILVHRILVNSILPTDRGGFDAQALYLNVCNYHQGKTILDPSQLAMFAKAAGIDPNIVFENVYAVSAFNEAQQTTATKEAAEKIEGNRDIRLLAVQNITRFIETSRKPLDARRTLKKVVGMLRRVASEKDIALVVTCTTSKSSRGRVPKPEGGIFLRHEANVVVYLDRTRRGSLHRVRATLVKHPYKRTPDSTDLFVQPGGVDLMGRITPSFRQLLQRQIEELRRSNGFQNTLIDLEHKRAFDLLLQEAWSAEGAAMSNSSVPCILDILNLMANIHNKKCAEALRRKCIELEKRLKELEDRNR